MAELHHLVETHQTNGGLGFIPPATIPSSEAPPETSAGPKRLRRPSVRLGDIGGGGGGEQYQQAPPYESHALRRPKWSGSRKESGKASSSSRTRALTNLSCNAGGLDEEEDPISIGTWRVNKWVKASSGGEATKKRVRSNWAATKFSEEEEEDLGFRDFSREDSESPTEEGNRTRYEMSGDWRSGGGGREGVKIWLQELGLGRYWPMFEMHEVDEEVLPLLTLEDLKDMGISAVGSRRKMCCAIQKLGREFS